MCATFLCPRALTAFVCGIMLWRGAPTLVAHACQCFTYLRASVSCMLGSTPVRGSSSNHRFIYIIYVYGCSATFFIFLSPSFTFLPRRSVLTRLFCCLRPMLAVVSGLTRHLRAACSGRDQLCAVACWSLSNVCHLRFRRLFFCSQTLFIFAA